MEQELSEDNIVRRLQLILNSNCQLVYVKSKVKVFVYSNDNNDDGAGAKTIVLRTFMFWLTKK